MGAFLSRFLGSAFVAGGIFAFTVSSTTACSDDGQTISSPCPSGQTCQVNLTLLHTSDIHSRLYPYTLEVTQVDSELGLGALNSLSTVGGVARQSYILNRERARSDRVLHLDSGDCFEGAPIFNFFHGEPEVRALSAMGTDAATIGNHEFDDGTANVTRQMQKWANFPLVLANYDFDPVGPKSPSSLDTVTNPFTTFNVDGLKIAVIGMGNLSSLTSLFNTPNSIGAKPINTIEVAQFYTDLLRPYVDVVAILSHLGLEADQAMVQGTTGIDVVLGGHNHIVINPPQKLQDCSADQEHPGYVWVPDPNLDVNPNIAPPNDAAHPDPVNHPWEIKRGCKPRNVLIMHSGAFSKYVGRLDLVLSNDPAQVSPTGNPADYDPVNGFEVVTSAYTPFPIDDTVPEDPVIVDMLQPYQRVLDKVADLNILVGYSPLGAKRTAPAGGDSALGNLIATGMWLRLGIQTDFSLTNTTGIRTDLNPGPITIEEMYNIFPFDNTITKMQLSGLEVEELFDFVARRSAQRACVSQAQIAGARVRINCAGCTRPDANVACTADTDCPGGDPGDCVLGKCTIPACAENIYIGTEADANGNRLPCGTDADCPEKLPDQCDKSGAAAGAPGFCLSPVISPTDNSKLTNLYELATSNYLAGGGSGFRVLQRNTTQLDTKIEQRDALIDYLRQGNPCGWQDPNAPGVAGVGPEGLKICAQDPDCSTDGSSVCACSGQVTLQGTGDNLTCASSGACSDGSGRCVPSDCRNTVAQFHENSCATAPDLDNCNTQLDACSLAGEECKFLACVDQTIGNFTDNRLDMVGR